MADKANYFTFIWKVENFSTLPLRKGCYLESPKFKVKVCGDNEYLLLLYPRGVKGKEGHVSCFLLNEIATSKFKFKFNFVLQSTETTDDIVSETLIFDQKIDSEFGIDCCFDLNEIYAKKHLYLPNDILTLRCHLFSNDEVSESGANDNEDDVNDNESAEDYVNDSEDSEDDATADSEDDAISTSEDYAISDREEASENNSCVCRSGTQVRRISTVWSILNINKHGKHIEKTFSSALSNSPIFKLSIKRDKNITNEFVPIKIRQTRDSLESGFCLKCKITVISSNKEHQNSSEGTHFFPETPHVWQFPPFIKASKLTSDKYLFLDDTLHLQCEFAFSFTNQSVYQMEDITIPPTFETRQNCTVGELSISIEKCYSLGKFCDIQLNADGHTLFAHRVVLGARSPVFCALFETDMKEKKTGIVDIVDVDPTTLKRMVDFLYDKEGVPSENLSPKDVCKLYEAADKYDVPSLKQRCWVLMISFMSVTSVCDILVIADAHHDSFLLTAVYNFICNHASETLHSPYWKSFMNDYRKLASKVMHKMLTERK